MPKADYESRVFHRYLSTHGLIVAVSTGQSFKRKLRTPSVQHYRGLHPSERLGNRSPLIEDVADLIKELTCLVAQP